MYVRVRAHVSVREDLHASKQKLRVTLCIICPPPPSSLARDVSSPLMSDALLNRFDQKRPMTNSLSRCDSPRRNARLKVNAPKFIRPNGFRIARACVRRAKEFHSRCKISLYIGFDFISLSSQQILHNMYMIIKAVSRTRCTGFSGVRVPRIRAVNAVCLLRTRGARAQKSISNYITFATACLLFLPRSSRFLRRL